MTPAMPETLSEGRFRLLEVIGEGGMATVYRAFDQRLQRPRAIKVLSPALASRPALRKRFLSEAQTMANLEESRVVRIFDMGEDGDRVFIVMELVDGGSLLDRVRDFGPLPPRMAAEATIQICESLQAAHDAGVIHRDIKPHNILLTKSGEIRVTDFGIAQVQSDDGDGMTKTGAVMGTWGFMAPEQKSNAKQVDARADVYSVGATLFSLLTGETPPELFMADAEPGMLQHVPEELAEVIKRATRYRREERYVTARAMAESLRAFLPMLPPDPELTIPLVPPTLEKRAKPLDTMQQFASEMGTSGETRGNAAATMVPNLAEAEDAEPSTQGPPKPATPSPADIPIRPLSAVDSIAIDPPPKRKSAAPLALGLGIAAIGAVVLVAIVGFLAFRPDPPPAPAPDPVATPVPTPPVVAPPPPTDTTQGASVAAPVPVPTPTDPRPTSPPVQPTTKPPNGTGPTSTPAPTPPVVAPPVTTPVASPTPPAETPAPPVETAPPAVDATGPAKLTHAPPPPVAVGESLTFSASIPGPGWAVKLYYRPASGGAYQEKAMQSAGGAYATSIKTTPEMADGIAYFISATKGGTKITEGSPTSPKKVQVVLTSP